MAWGEMCVCVCGGGGGRGALEKSSACAAGEGCYRPYVSRLLASYYFVQEFACRSPWPKKSIRGERKEEEEKKDS